jgi:hypothetical protein
MILGQKVTERTNSRTNSVLAQTCMGIFLIRQVTDVIFGMAFLPKPPADHLANLRGPQFDKHWPITYLEGEILPERCAL